MNSQIQPTSHPRKNAIAVRADCSTPPQSQMRNSMHPIRWISSSTRSLLDVGCNVGELLSHCRQLYPSMELAGVEVNRSAVETSRQRFPDTDIREASAENLPFSDASFDCVTCIEVIEHIPKKLRRRSFSEMRRVLRPDGRLVLRTPHAGLFAWLDPNNLRFRLPALYRFAMRTGGRDGGYPKGFEDIVWHHHFTRGELLDLAGEGWGLETVRFGGLLLMPLTDLLRWPFYRMQRTSNVAYQLLQRLSEFDIRCDYGVASYDILLVLRRVSCAC